MSLSFWLYIANVIDNFNCALAILAVVLILIAAFIAGVWLTTNDTFGYSSEEEAENQKIKNACRNYAVKIAISFSAILTIAIFVPSSTTIYMMLGADYLGKTNIPTKVEQALEHQLDKLIKDKQDGTD